MLESGLECRFSVHSRVLGVEFHARFILVLQGYMKIVLLLDPIYYSHQIVQTREIWIPRIILVRLLTMSQVLC